MANMGYSYKLFSATFYGDLYEGILPEISKLVTPQKLENPSLEIKEVGDLLKKMPGIENIYVINFY